MEKIAKGAVSEQGNGEVTQNGIPAGLLKACVSRRSPIVPERSSFLWFWGSMGCISGGQRGLQAEALIATPNLNIEKPAVWTRRPCAGENQGRGGTCERFHKAASHSPKRDTAEPRKNFVAHFDSSFLAPLGSSHRN